MKYMGSKNRIAKHILPIMLKYRTEGMTWVEPMVGGGNMIDKVEGKRIGADINPHLIKALVLVRDTPELIPRNNKEYTEDMFNLAKQSELNNPVDCFAMFQYTFGSIFKGSWAKNKRGTDYVRECVKNVLLQSEKIQDVCFVNSRYQELQLPPNSLIYCDPPYEGTAKYKTEEFNHAEFWEWCRNMVKDKHKVFISEYNAPEDFICIWSQEINNNFNDSKPTEKLFIHESQLNSFIK